MEDIIIRGGTVVDGTGAPGYRADVAVRGGVITGIGDLSRVSAGRTLDAEGMVVSPGFIDAHAHSDTAFLADDSGASKLYQGVTTEVTGQCGASPFPAMEADGDDWRCASFDGFTGRFLREGRVMGVNQAMLVGHGSLRAAVMGYEDRPPTPGEMARMKELLRRDLTAGAWGLSLGLEYSPGFFAGAEELNGLGAVAREFDGLVTCHLRSEGLRIDEAVEELLNVGRSSGVKVHISHLKLDNYRVHGRAAAVWERIERARQAGVRVSADMYPFTASCTGLVIRCPKWSQEGGPEAVVERLRGPRRAEIVEGIRQHYFSAGRAETCLFNDDGGLWPQIVGKTLRQVAEEALHTTDYAEAAARVLTVTRGRANCIFFVMSEEDMLYFLARDVGIGSDGWALSADPAKVSGRPHPRSYAAISEFFRLARERNLCPLEEAVRRVTLKAARMAGMADRGVLRPGMVADVTVFDPVGIGPRATYLDPVRLSAGVRHVLIGGGLALCDGRQTALRAGQFLRKAVVK